MLILLGCREPTQALAGVKEGREGEGSGPWLPAPHALQWARCSFALLLCLGALFLVPKVLYASFLLLKETSEAKALSPSSD